MFSESGDEPESVVVKKVAKVKANPMKQGVSSSETISKVSSVAFISLQCLQMCLINVSVSIRCCYVSHCVNTKSYY